MGKRLMDKMLNFMGIEDEMEEEQGHKDGYREEEQTIKPKTKKNQGQVVSIHAQRQVRVMVAEPRDFDDVREIVDNLKNRRPVIVNLENAEAELARRVLDFVSGATYALDGKMQKVGKSIVVTVPSNMDIDSVVKEQNSEKGVLSWLAK